MRVKVTHLCSGCGFHWSHEVEEELAEEPHSIAFCPDCLDAPSSFTTEKAPHGTE